MKRVGLKQVKLVSALCLCTGLCQGTLAAQVLWDNQTGNSRWNTPVNWQPNGVPLPANSIRFDSTFVSTAQTVDLATDRTIDGVLGFSGSVNYTLVNFTLTLGNTVTNNASGTITISSAVILAGDRTFRMDGSGDFIIAGSVSGDGLIKEGAGLLTLNASNSFSGLVLNAGTVGLGHDQATGAGGITINGGALAASGGARTISAPVVVGGSFAVNGTEALTLTGDIDLGGTARTITINNTADTTFSGIVSGTGDFTKSGDGLLRLAGASGNTHSGATIVTAGMLWLEKSGGNAILGDLTIGDGVGGSGADVVRLGAANQIADTVSVTINSSGLLDLNGFNETVRSVSSTSAGSRIALGAGTLTIGDAGASTFAGEISGSGSLVKQGSGTLVLSGSSTYTGVTTINEGVLNVQHGSALGTGAGGTVVNSGTALELQGGITVSAEPLTLDGHGIASAGALRSISGNNTWNGPITLGSDSRIRSEAGTLTIGGDLGGSGYDLILDGLGSIAISGAIQTGAGSVFKGGLGDVTLSGANTYTGTTVVNAGALFLGANNVLHDSSSLTLNQATFHLGAYSERIGTLSFSDGTIDFGTPGSANYFLFASEGDISGILTLVNWEANVDRFAYLSTTTLSSEFTSSIFFSGFGSGAITQGTDQTIAGYSDLWNFLVPNTNFVVWTGGHGNSDFWSQNANWQGSAPSSGIGLKLAFDGTTRLTPDMNADYTANTLRFNTGAGSFTLTSTGGYTLTFGGIRPGVIQLSPNDQAITHAVALDTLTLFEMTGTGALTLSGGVSGVGGIEKIGPGRLILAGNNTYSGATLINVGTVRLRHDNALGATSGGTVVQAGAALELENGISIGAESLTLSGTGVSSGGALRNIAGNNSWAGDLTLGSTASIGSDAGALTLAGSVNNAGNLLLLAGDGAITLNGVVSGSGGLTKNGPGVTTLSGAGANTYSGVTTINAGTLVLGKTAGVNAIAGNISIGDGVGGIGTDILRLDANNQIADVSALTLGASGRFDLNDFSETIGSLASSSADSRVTLGESLLSPGTLTIGDGTSTTFAGVISGTGALVKQGSGILTLAGANTYSGVTTINEGALNLQNAAALGSILGGTVVNSGGALELQGVIAVGNEPLTLNGTGVGSGGALRQVSGNSSWAGPITLGSASRVNSDAGTLTLSGSITGTGQNLTIGGSGNVTISGVLSPGIATLSKDGTGSVTLTSANSHAGTTLNAGTLAVGHNSALGAGTLTLTGGTLAASGASRTVGNAVTLNGNVTIGGEDDLEFTGTWTQTGGNRTLLINNEATTVFSGAGGLQLSDNNTSRTLTVETAGGTVIMNSVIANGGTGAGSLTKTGAGTLILNAANTYTGTTTISAGTISLGASERLADSSSMNLSGGTFDLGGLYTERLGLFTFNNGTLDFGAPGTANHFLFQGESAAPSNPLIVFNWENGVDRFAFESSSTLSQSFLDNIYFAGFGSVAQLSAANQTIGGYGSIWTFLLPTDQFYDTWSGGHPNSSNWSQNLNWQDGSAPPGGVTTRVAFDGNTRLTPNLNANFTLNSLRFNTNASGFTISSLDDRVLNFSGILPSIMQRSANNQTINARMNFNTTTLIDATGAGTLTLGGSLSGSGGLTKIGDGTVILTASNTFAGAISIHAGVMNVRNSDALGSTGGGTVIYAGGSLELQGGISLGAEPLTLNGTGIGGAGALRNVADNNSLAGTILLGSATRIQSEAGTSLTLSGNLSGAGQSLTLGGAGDITLSGVVGIDAGTLTKEGSGTLTLSGGQANTYTGLTTVNEGLLVLNKTAGVNAITGPLAIGDGIVRLNAANQIGDSAAVTIDAAGLFDLNGFDERIGALAGGSSSAQVSLGSGTLTIGNSVSTTFAGVIDGAGSLVKEGSSVLTLTGTNTYSGATTINDGMLSLQNSHALGATAAGTTVNEGGTLAVEGNITVQPEPVTLHGDGVASAGALRNLSGNNTWTGPLTLGMAASIGSDAGTLTISGSLNNDGNLLTFRGEGDLSVTGIISGSGGLTKAGTGTLMLAAANTYSGSTLISEGVVRLQNPAALGSSVAGTTVAAGGALELEGEVTVTDEALTISGSGIAGTGALRNLSDTNTWTGPLTLGMAATIGSDAGWLTLSGAIDNGGHTLTFAGAGHTFVGGVIGGSGGLVKDGAGTLMLAGANTYSGPTVINDGVVNIRHDTALGDATAGTTVNPGGALELQDNVTISNEPLNLAGTGVSDGGALRNVDGDNTYQGPINLDDDTRINADAGSLTLSGGITGTDTDLTVGGAGTTIIDSIIDLGLGSLIKDGLGRLELTGNNTFDGTFHINEGVVNIRHNNALGTTVGGTIVGFGAALELQGGITVGLEDLSLDGSGISNGGALRSVSGDNFYQGHITLAGDARINTDADSLTLSGGISGADKNLTVGGAGTTIINSAIALGNGSLSKDGAGRLELSGDNTFAGTFNIDAGVVNIQHVNALGTTAGATIVNSGAALELQGNLAVGAEALTLSGSGPAENGALRSISGDNSWAGSLTLGAAATVGVDANTLTLGGNIDNSGFDLTVKGAGDSVINGAISGAGGLVKEGPGTLTLNGASSFAGNVTINEGTLLLGASDRIGDNTGMNLAGGTFHTGGFNETLGVLTLSASSIIDLGDSGTSVLVFADSSGVAWNSEAILEVVNWSGSETGGGDERIHFGGLTDSQLAQIVWRNPFGDSEDVWGAKFSANGEIVPVPEPATILAGLFLLAAVCYRERKLLLGWLRLLRRMS